ncbi:MAG: hypothetical protein FJ150_06020 [Euryarchaeota archaeon]|nr:hypothetical protein [Euryarchaeota archaeon]
MRSLQDSFYLYDAQTLKPIKKLNISGGDFAEPRWDVIDPNKLYYIKVEDTGNTKLMSYNIQNHQTTLVHDFATDFPGQSLAAVWSRYEGSPSNDGRYCGLMAQDQNWNTLAFLIYDQFQDKVIAKINVPPDMGSIDSVSISPLGNYFIAAASDKNAWIVYDQTLKELYSLKGVGHCDFALDANEQEVLVYQDTSTDYISMADLATGKVTPLWQIDFTNAPNKGFHFSGRAYKQPGWVIVGCYGVAPNGLTWMDNTIFAMELKPNGRVVRLAHHHSVYDANQEHDYWAEPHATANRDLTKILFTSNWGKTGTEQVEMYMIELPNDWISKL